MTLSIESIRPAGDAEWDAAWSGCPHATYFHSREWAEIWRECSAGALQPCAATLQFSDGRTALLPLSVESAGRGLVKRHHSSPAGTFGGWISGEELQAPHARLLAGHLAREYSDIVWRINPYDPLAGENPPDGCAADDTQVLPLAQGFDAIRRTWSKESILYEMRRGMEFNLEIAKAGSLAEWEEYFEVYRHTRSRWKEEARTFYGLELFSEMFRRQSPHIHLWLAKTGGRIAAGALCFSSGRHVVYWHGAALKEFFHMRPVIQLIHEAVRESCALGKAWFDFNPSGGLKGVRAFKKSFGAETMPCPLFIRQGGLARFIGRVKKMLPARAGAAP